MSDNFLDPKDNDLSKINFVYPLSENLD